MAFPQIQSADTQTGSGSATPAVMNYPTNLASGDLILYFFCLDARRTVTGPASPWVTAHRPYVGGGSSSSFLTFAWGKKVSLGTESGSTFSITYTSSGGWCCRAYRVTGWEGTIGSSFASGSSDGGAQMLFAEGNGATPDPPSLDPSWGVEDTLWLATDARDSTGAVTAYPLPDHQGATTSSGGIVAVCADELAQASLNPGTFSHAAGFNWIAATFAIQPAAAVAPWVPSVVML